MPRTLTARSHTVDEDGESPRFYEMADHAQAREVMRLFRDLIDAVVGRDRQFLSDYSASQELQSTEPLALLRRVAEKDFELGRGRYTVEWIAGRTLMLSVLGISMLVGLFPLGPAYAWRISLAVFLGVVALVGTLLADLLTRASLADEAQQYAAIATLLLREFAAVDDGK